MAAAGIANPAGGSMVQSVKKRAMRKSFSMGQGLNTTSVTEEERSGSSPTQVLWLNLKETGLPDDAPIEDFIYTPRASQNPSPVNMVSTGRRKSRKELFRTDSDRRMSVLSSELNLTSRRSTGDSVFGSPTKPVMKKRGSILRRKSSFGGFTEPSSPNNSPRKKPLKKSVSFQNLGALDTARSEGYNNRRASVSVRRLSSVTDGGEPELPPEVGMKRTRRTSMMTSLRAELMQLDKTPVKRFNEQQLINEQQLLNNTRNLSARRENSEVLAEEMEAKARHAEMKHRPSVPVLYKRSDSVDSTNLVSTYDLKKFEMLQSLEKMGVDLKKNRRSDTLTNDEARILQMAAKGNRHGSLSSRTVISHFRSSDQFSKESPGSGVELDAATREKLQKIYDQMIKPDAKMAALPGLFGRNRQSVTSDELAADTINVFKRRMRRKKKPKNRFQRLGRFVLVLLRLWGHHAKKVNELLEFVQSVDMKDKEDKKDLLFDITEFKSEKEAHVPQEAKRILKKRPKERTPEEVHYVQIALRNYKSIAEYPVHMQKKMAERAWFEGFGPKRVIVREGHIPMCFYFVMSGSAVVSVMDLEKGLAKTVLYYGRGDSFGELAIMNETRRQSTVISKEAIELLVLSDEDFIEIFMSGGLKDPHDPFLCSLSYLDGWPIEKLSENPKKAQFCYYKRGSIMVKDSKDNDWIVIVKSGSCRLLKELKHVDPTRPRKKKEEEKGFREALIEELENESFLSHEEKVQLSVQRQLRDLEQQNQLMRFYALPEINIPANDAYNELKKMHEEHAEHVGASIAEKLRESAALSRNPTNMSMERQRTSSAMGGKQLGSLVKKGPYMTKSSTHASETDMNKEPTRQGTTFSDFLRANAASTSAMDHANENKKPKPQMFVNVQTLTKGMVFGLSDIYFEDQPSLVLVSNGAECITINKKLFLDHATHAFTTKLREDIYPYPTEQEMQENMADQVYWSHHKRQQIGGVIRDINFKRSEPHDARARFTPDLAY